MLPREENAVRARDALAGYVKLAARGEDLGSIARRCGVAGKNYVFRATQGHDAPGQYASVVPENLERLLEALDLTISPRRAVGDWVPRALEAVERDDSLREEQRAVVNAMIRAMGDATR